MASACTSTRIGRAPSSTAATAEPGTPGRRSRRNRADASGTSTSPRSVISNNPTSSVPPIPQVWIEAGAEIALTQARAWTASLQLGVTWFPEVQTGAMLQGRIARLFSGDASSLTNPDIYGFVGGTIIVMQGAGALTFRDKTPNIADILGAATGVSNPQAIWGAGQVGLMMRVKNRIAIDVYAEAAPTLGNATGIGNYIDLGITKVQSVGGEVSFCF